METSGGDTIRGRSTDDLPARAATFLAEALRAGGAAIAIARPEHLATIGDVLSDLGLDPTALSASSHLILLDAQTTLTAISIDGIPDATRFRAVVGAAIGRARAVATGTVRVYGEMMDLVWAQRRPQLLVPLEAMWTDLLATQPVELMGGHRLGASAVARGSAPIPRVALGSSAGLALASGSSAGLALDAAVREAAASSAGGGSQRLEQLLAVTCELAEAHTHDDVARVTVDQGIAAVGASYGGLWLLDGDELAMLAVSALPRGTADAWSRIPLHTDAPVPHVVRTGEALFLESLDDYRARFPASFERIQSTVSHAELAYAMLPLVGGDGRVLGALSLSYANARRVSDAERTFLRILARQCGLALERVRLREVERAAREEAELMYALTAACNQLEELDEIYQLALHTVARGTASDRAAVLLFDAAGSMRFVASHLLSATYRTAVDGHSPWARDAVDPQPVLVHDTEADEAWARYRPVFRAEGIRGLAFVPIVHRGALLGKFMLYRDTPRLFRPDEIRLASAIAAHVAQAVTRVQREHEVARLYRVERDAHVEAEESTRAREEILSVVSHDLRNPLGTIMMGASTLIATLAADDPDKRIQRVYTVAERIHRQAGRMARLIEDLVDFASIQAGRLAILRTPQPAAAIIAQTRELFHPLASERGVAFEATAGDGLPEVPCDPERAVQILGNLVSNAIKVTPKGGSITIGATGAASDSDVVFYVRDTGPGIAAEEMPNLFARFWRSKQATYKGAGLGLSIARGLVEAHGGRIWAESEVGAGSTFFFSLTAPRN